MKAVIYDKKGEKKEEIKLPAEIFGAELNKDLLHQVVVSYQKNSRRGTAHAKDRSEVSGSKTKPWPQKGTGRARHGDRYSPIWRKGGVAHGPRKEKKYRDRVPKKMKIKALIIALSNQAKEGRIFVFDNIELQEPKTKLLAELVNNLTDKIEKLEKETVLIITAQRNEKLVRAGKNIPYLEIKTARMINALDVLKYKYILISQDSIEVLKKRLNKANL